MLIFLPGFIVARFLLISEKVKKCIGPALKMTDQNKYWYAFRALWNTQDRFVRYLHHEGIEYYLPEKVYEKPSEDLEKGKPLAQKISRKTLRVEKVEDHVATLAEIIIPGLVFVHTTAIRAKILQCDQVMKSFPYNVIGTTTPAIIPDREMEQFRWIVRTGSEVVEAIDVRFAKGERVRVTGGPFAGAEGRICRIKGNRRFVVEIQGIVAVATSYIPRCYLQKISDISCNKQ